MRRRLARRGRLAAELLAMALSCGVVAGCHQPETASAQDAALPDAAPPDLLIPSDADSDPADAIPTQPDAALPDAEARAQLEPGEAEAAGTGTVSLVDARAYSQPLTGLSGPPRTAWFTGQALFQLDWTVPTATPSDRAGLGPTYNSTACQACHFANGRGAPPTVDGGALVTALLRVSLPGRTEHGAPLPHPIYGDQIQPRAVGDVPAEGTVRVYYDELPGAYDDGTPYTLLRPRFEFDPALGDPGPELLRSVRVAPAIIGMGLLAAIPEDDLLARADPDDADGDGISGRPNHVWDEVAGRAVLGRFGWKANQPTLQQQNAAAFSGDIGITTPLYPEANCPAPQTACAAGPQGPSPEVDLDRLAALTDFVRGTGVPARRHPDDPTVLRGKLLFHDLGCAACHVPSWRTGEVPDLPPLSKQRVWPYTDLLLHDLGAGLADGRPDFEASGSEWRTPPLWGLGLQKTVSKHQRLLHDGRARGPAEAILWHGGEAQAAAERFRRLPARDRQALEAFLDSL